MTLVQRVEIGKAIGSAFLVVGRGILVWIGLAIAFYAVPMFALQSLILAPTVRVSADAGMSLLRSYSWQPAVLTFAYITGILLLYAAVARGTIEALKGKRAWFGDCFSAVMSALLPLLGLSALAWLTAVVLGLMGDLAISGLINVLPLDYVELAIWLALIALNIPFIVIVLRWGLTVPAIVHERRGVLAAMRRSAQLTKGSRWALFGLIVALGAVVTLLELASVFALVLVEGRAGIALDMIVEGVIWTIVATALAVSYAQLREAKEGTPVQDLTEIFS